MDNTFFENRRNNKEYRYLISLSFFLNKRYHRLKQSKCRSFCGFQIFIKDPILRNDAERPSNGCTVSDSRVAHFIAPTYLLKYFFLFWFIIQMALQITINPKSPLFRKLSPRFFSLVDVEDTASLVFQLKWPCKQPAIQRTIQPSKQGLAASHPPMYYKHFTLSFSFFFFRLFVGIIRDRRGSNSSNAHQVKWGCVLFLCI